MDKCANCNTEIPTPVFKFGGRQNGKNTMLLYYNIRQACCSDECCREFIKKMEDVVYGQN